MRIIGAEVAGKWQTSAIGPCTVAVLREDGRIGEVVRVGSLPELAATVARAAGSEPFLLAVNLPIVVPGKASRSRPVEGVVRRRFGFRAPAGGRAALSAGPLGVVGETLMAGLAAAGHPVLPYPDRDRRQSGIVETYPELVLKALLWEASDVGESREAEQLQQMFKAFVGPAYRAARLKARSDWTEQAVQLDLALRLLAPVEGLDIEAVRRELREAGSAAAVERAGALLDAALMATLARRYLETPETCLFVGDREAGYMVMPADRFVRGLGTDGRRPAGQLFPQASLRERLGPGVKLRQESLIDIPGRPHRMEAIFEEPPTFEFDNVDEMLWWKHTRCTAGKPLPTEGLAEIVVELDGAGTGSSTPLVLARSRHATLSFRFTPPAAWRTRVPTRDGHTYKFRVLRALYETRE